MHHDEKTETDLHHKLSHTSCATSIKGTRLTRANVVWFGILHVLVGILSVLVTSYGVTALSAKLRHILQVYMCFCHISVLLYLVTVASKVTEINRISVIMRVSDQFSYGKLETTEY